jgi:hypothetical protein
MAADYRLDLALRRHPIVPAAIARALGSNVGGDGEEEEEGDRRRIAIELEGTIERLERDLDGAQRTYAESNTPPSRGGGVERRTDDGVEEDAADRPNERSPLTKRREKEAMLSIAGDLADAREELSSLLSAAGGGDGDGGIIGGGLHARNARRLLDLCRANGGVYVKVGQHLANLDLLLPAEYVDALSSLFDDAPVSSYDDVRRVVIEELGSDPDELFANFSREPFASASLAQVHEATCRETGNRLAIKVQHRGLRETSRGDLLAMATVVGVAERLFDDFNFGWICEELTPQVRTGERHDVRLVRRTTDVGPVSFSFLTLSNRLVLVYLRCDAPPPKLPKELDFNNEGENAETAAAHLERTGLDCIVPNVFWEFTNERVLTMQFEEGFRATDVESIDSFGISRR